MKTVDNPDQNKLKIARMEIEAVLRKHDLAGCCLLHTPGMSEFFYDIRPSYSVCWVEEPGTLHIKSELAEGYENQLAQYQDIRSTANMTHSFADGLTRAAVMFTSIDQIIGKTFAAEHTDGEHIPEKKQ